MLFAAITNDFICNIILSLCFVAFGFIGGLLVARARENRLHRQYKKTHRRFKRYAAKAKRRQQQEDWWKNGEKPPWEN